MSSNINDSFNKKRVDNHVHADLRIWKIIKKMVKQTKKLETHEYLKCYSFGGEYNRFT